MLNKNIEKITMYSTSWCADCFRARMFFDKNDVSYEEIDIEKDPNAAEKVEKINEGNRSVPTIITTYKNGETGILVEPDTVELEEFFLEK